MTNYRTLMEFMTSIEHIRNVTYRIFKRGNAADSKRNWYEFASSKRPHVYDGRVYVILGHKKTPTLC